MEIENEKLQRKVKQLSESSAMGRHATENSMNAMKPMHSTQYSTTAEHSNAENPAHATDIGHESVRFQQTNEPWLDTQRRERGRHSKQVPIYCEDSKYAQSKWSAKTALQCSAHGRGLTPLRPRLHGRRHPFRIWAANLRVTTCKWVRVLCDSKIDILRSRLRTVVTVTVTAMRVICRDGIRVICTALLWIAVSVAHLIFII